MGNVSFLPIGFSGREKFSGYEKHWKCFVVRGVSEGNLFWFSFLELRGFETVFELVFTMCHVCLSGELLWLDDLLHAHPQFGNILCGALLPSVMRRESHKAFCQW